MNLLRIVMIGGLISAASISYGQSATLTGDAAIVSTGSVLTLRTSVVYPATPKAVGWTITLPEGWSFVATGGPDIPQVTPEAGSTGTLEWAYANVPDAMARFSFTVKAAGNPGLVQLHAKVYLRVDGKQQDVDVVPVSVTVGR